MPTTTRDKNSLPVNLVLHQSASKSEHLEYVGQSIWGYVYYSKTTPSIYRLISIDYANLDRKEAMLKMIERPRKRGIIPAVAAKQDEVAGVEFYIIRYEGAPNLSFLEILEDSDPIKRLEYSIKVIKALTDWRGCRYISKFLTPVDIFFIDNLPYLAAMPDWGIPEIEVIFQNPQLAMYLPPQLICGKESYTWKNNCDLYSLGAALLQIFYRLPAKLKPEAILAKIANASIFSEDGLESNLPFWTQRVEAFQDSKVLIHRVVHRDLKVRTAIDPTNLANQLNEYKQKMDPIVVIKNLRSSKKFEEAFNLLQDVLLDQSSYELLLLAGEIAFQDLVRPLESIDWYERAIEKYPKEKEAYRKQFNVIVSLKTVVGILTLFEERQTANEQLDKMIQRDFKSMDTEEQKSNEVQMARHFIWREQFSEASYFIHPRIIQGEKHLWWKFEMNLLYTETLVGLKRFSEAQEFLKFIREKLKHVQRNKSLDSDEIFRLGTILSEIEVNLYDKKGLA
jgi:tetratricopeptide (TPR) repeat protein